VGDEIVIAPTGKSAWESEIRKIVAVSEDMTELTLNSSLVYKHIGKLLQTYLRGAATVYLAPRIHSLDASLMVF